MKRFFSLILALLLILSSFSGCKKEPAETQPSTGETVPVEPGLELEENGVVYESLAQKAVVKTALAYLARGARIQYDDTNMLIKGAPTMYRWQHGVRKSPEEYTSQNTGYSNCAAFTYDVYLAALDMKIGGFTTKALTDVGGKQRIFSYYPKGGETTEEQKEIKEKFMSKLKPGDLIIVRYNGSRTGNGHAMLYVGKAALKGVEGVKENHDIIHSSGSSYKYADRKETYEATGTVRTLGADWLFNPESSMYVFGKLNSIVILRPLAVFNKDVPENTLNRMKNLNNVVVEKLVSGTTAGPGDVVTYSFSITNNNDKEITLAIEDVISPYATFVASEKTHPCTVEGDSLKWQVKVPAKQTVTVTYDVKIKADAQAGQSLAGNKATVGGVSTPCPYVFVARTLTQQEQADLLAGIQALADSRLLRGAELVNALYSKALKVEKILPEDFTGIWESLFRTYDELSYIKGESPYADAVVPGMLGGRNLVSRNLAADNMAQYIRLESIRSRLPYENQLMVGDVLMGELGPEETDRVMYLYTGETMLNLLSGKEIEYKPAQDCLNPVMSYKRFVILRPSMLLDRQQQQ